MGLQASRPSGEGRSGCGGCFGAFKSRPKPGETFVPRPPPSDSPTLSVQARIAARKGDPETLDLLPKVLGQTLHGFDQEGRTLLFYAVRGTRDDDGRLEPAGGSMAGPRSKEFAPGLKQGDAAAHLVQAHGFDVNFQVHDTGMTPLMEAVRYANADAVKTLMELGADPSLPNVKGQTACDIAHTKLPEYLNINEVMCSQNRWDAIRVNIDAERETISHLLVRTSSGGVTPKAG